MKNSTGKIFIAIFLGLVLGIIMSGFEGTVYYDVSVLFVAEVLSTLFINALKLMIVPLVFVSLVCGISELKDVSRLGKIGMRTVTVFFLTTIFAVIIALGLASLLNPSTTENLSKDTISDSAIENLSEPKTPVETITSVVATNPIDAMAKGDMMQVIFISVIVGIALVSLGDKVSTIKKFFDESNLIMTKLVAGVMYYAPIGIFFLIFKTFATLGFEIFTGLLSFVFVVLLAMVLHVIIVYCSMLKFIVKVSPIMFFKKFMSVIAIAFSTSSSSATLSENLDVSINKLGVDKEVASFALPLGATINMDGTAIMQGVATIFIANSYGYELTFMNLLTVVIVAIMASVGTAGVPGVGILMLAIVLESVNIPAGTIALVIGIDRIIDMFRTSLNVVGDSVCSLVVAKKENLLDLEVFNK